jgi:choice-of-anchor B domain-containing protein
MASNRLRLTTRITLGALSLVAGPLAAQEANYGTGAAISGREVYIGQPANQYGAGYVYGYKADARGVWKEAVRLTAPADSGRSDGFGRKIAIDGNTMLISQSPSDSSSAGLVHVYERASATAPWKKTGALMAEGAVKGDRVGRSLALVGDVAVVGATRTDSLRGAVFVFRRSGGQWKQEAKLRPDEIKPGNNYATNIAFDGWTILVSAAQADSNAGAAFVYRRNASNGWDMEGKLQLPAGSFGPPNPAVQSAQRLNSAFGAAVLLHEGAAYVGAPNVSFASGRVVRFVRDSVQKRWNSTSSLFPFQATQGTQFGAALAASGKELWVGAPGANQFHGVVFRYTLDTAGVVADVSRMPYDSTMLQVGFGGNLLLGNGLGLVAMPNADFSEGRSAVVVRNAAGKWTQQTLTGQVFRPRAIAGKETSCAGGKVGEFDCEKTSLLSMIPIAEMGGGASRLNTVWGWTDPQTNKEYALVGRSDGTSFLDVTNPLKPVYLGNLPKTPEAPATVWREFKVMHNWVYIVSDGAPKHGMQAFDLTRLRNVKTPQTFKPDVLYDKVSAAHNVAVNPETHTVFITGANSGGETCGGGLHMVDAKDPRNLKFIGCFQDMGTGFAGTGYSHDVQCVIYHGPDTRYSNREICFGGNETALSVGDVTDRANMKSLGRGTYPDFGYIHQGWLTEDHKYLYVNDELDELQGKAPQGTRTIIFDVTKLDDPVVAGTFIGTTKATDHNLYIQGDKMFQSNYQAGLRIIDIKDRLKPKEVSYFDVVPVGDNGPGFGGTWNNYPYFKSGTILISSAREGLFLVKDQSTDLTP